MESTTDLGGCKPNSKANWKNKPKSGTHVSKFTGAATSESVLHNKIIISGTNQDRQIFKLVEAIPSFISTNHYANWAESFRNRDHKLYANFIPTAPCKQDCGTVNAAGVFQWQPNTLDTEEDHNRDYKTWDKYLTAGIKQCNNYVNNSEYIFLAIYGQMELSLWDKTKDNAQFVAIQTFKYPIALIKLMKDRSTGTMTRIW